MARLRQRPPPLAAARPARRARREVRRVRRLGDAAGVLRGRRQGAHRRPRGGRASSTSATSARRSSAAPAPRRSSTRTLTNDLGRIGPGQAQYTLCCDDATGGVVDDLIAYLRDDDARLPGPQRRQHRRGRAPAGRPRRRTASTVTDQHRDYAVLAVQGPQSDEVLERVGLPTGHDYMSFVETRRSTASAVVVCRTGYTGERGYELIAAERRRRRAVGRAARGRRASSACCRAGSAPATRCAPRWATRCTARTSRSTSRPVQARLGWAVGWKKDAFWGTRRAARREGGRARRGCCAGWSRPAAASRARTCAWPDRRRAARRGHLAARSRRPCAGASGWRCCRRRSPPTPRSASTSAAGARSSSW